MVSNQLELTVNSLVFRWHLPARSPCFKFLFLPLRRPLPYGGLFDYRSVSFCRTFRWPDSPSGIHILGEQARGAPTRVQWASERSSSFQKSAI